MEAFFASIAIRVEEAAIVDQANNAVPGKPTRIRHLTILSGQSGGLDRRTFLPQVRSLPAGRSLRSSTLPLGSVPPRSCCGAAALPRARRRARASAHVRSRLDAR